LNEILFKNKDLPGSDPGNLTGSFIINFPDQLVMEGNHFYGIFLFCHDEILSGSAFSVKVYVFMEDLPVGPRLFPI
jgi:hypothetical protein